jgi:glycosyltransferase involved in cell wall biosynthesis
VAIPDYLERLRKLADDVAPELKIVYHEPAPPDSMVDLCRGYDVGLALEQKHVLNRALCLTNKAFTYMLGGLALVLTDTPGQRPLGLDVGEGAILYMPGDVPALAAGLKRWAEDKCILARARAAGWQAAQRRWHWEHPAERGALLGAVARALAR